MKQFLYRWTTVLTIVAVLLAAAPSHSPSLYAQGDPVDPQLFVPVIILPPRPPQFVIISPPASLSISGMSLFAVQPAIPGTVSRVEFRAGDVDLGVDDTPSNGFQVFLDAGQLPAGPLTLSATATGTTGQTATETVEVTVVQQPPANAGVDARGATLATASGNTIVVPPGAVSQTTTIAVADKTQEQVTADSGIDWDALGVTFLGAIDVQTNGPLARPLGVSSVGFGNRIQPGQAVVTYRILPDADGDGVGELVVVNGAELAPNGTIVSSAVNGIIVNRLHIATVGGASRQAGPLQGPPGAMLTIEGSGFNPLSSVGNLAIFRSEVDGTTLIIPGVVEETPRGQTFQVLLPPLPAGAATLTLKNQSTGETVGPFDVVIAAPPSLSQPAATIIETFLDQSIAMYQGMSDLTLQQESHRMVIVARLADVHTQFQQLAADPSPASQQMVTQFATAIEGSGIMSMLEAEVNASAQLCFTSHQKNVMTYQLALGGIALALSCIVFTGPAAAVCAATVAAAGATVAYRLAEEPVCQEEPPPDCSPAPAASGGGTTGMGAAPPPGGNGCGNAAGGGGGSVQGATVDQLESGRYRVRVFPSAGSSAALTPFTGATDPGGYFFIPLIPADEPFLAVATDRFTGASVTLEGVGPALNQSVFMNFDFTGAQDNLYAIQIGDTITNGVPGLGAGNIEEPGGVDIYTFNAVAGQQVFFDLFGVDNALVYASWKLIAPNGDILFDQILNCCGGVDAGVHTLPETGVYTLRIGESPDPGTGTYGFTLWHVPPPDEFSIAIGDSISPGAPGPGAGRIESPGVKDIYTFNAIANQQIYLEAVDVDAGLAQIDWKLVTPDGEVIFDRILNCCGGVDAGVYTLSETGVYTLTVGDDRDAGAGTYGFTLWHVPPPDEFSIAIGDTVSPGAPGPGAGQIESPGVKDIYTFNAIAGQQVYFALFDVDAALAQINWKLVAPDGEVIFDRILNCCGGLDAGEFTLEQTGVYTLTVGDDRDAGVGSYSFELRLPE